MSAVLDLLERGRVLAFNRTLSGEVPGGIAGMKFSSPVRSQATDLCPSSTSDPRSPKPNS